VTVDPPFSNLDLISCRDILTWFQPELQKKLLSLFHYALRPAESFCWAPRNGRALLQSLHPLLAKAHIYARNSVLTGRVVASGDRGASPKVLSAATAISTPMQVPGAALAWRKSEAGRLLLLAKYGPAGVVINQNFEIVQFRGHTDPFLKPVHGTANPIC
jgi:two-component system CheB/CheR fusion protein